MENEDDFGNMSQGPSGAVKTIIFIMVAVLIITTVAIPILASAGEVSTSHMNEGVRVSDLAEKYGDYFAQGEDVNNYNIAFGSEGVTIGNGTGAENRKTILTNDQIDVNYPVYMAYGIYSDSTQLWVYFTYNDTEYTCHQSQGGNLTESTWSDGASVSILGLTAQHHFVQDPKGDYILTNGTLSYIGDDVTCTGFTISNEALLWVCGTDATLRRANSTPIFPIQTGTAIWNMTSDEDINTLSDMSFNGVYTTYLIGPRGYTTSENIIDGSIIGTLLGIIPLLMIVGVVIYVVGRMNVSDR